jgi:glycine betaine catabolism A
VLIHRLLPLGIDRTRIVCDRYFHPDAIAQPDIDPAPAIDLWDLTNRQDWELCANAYKGVSSEAWEPCPYAELESQLAAFDRQHRQALAPEAPAQARRRA